MQRSDYNNCWGCEPDILWLWLLVQKGGFGWPPVYLHTGNLCALFTGCLKRTGIFLCFQRRLSWGFRVSFWSGIAFSRVLCQEMPAYAHAQMRRKYEVFRKNRFCKVVKVWDGSPHGWRSIVLNDKEATIRFFFPACRALFSGSTTRLSIGSRSSHSTHSAEGSWNWRLVRSLLHVLFRIDYTPHPFLVYHPLFS